MAKCLKNKANLDNPQKTFNFSIKSKSGTGTADFAFLRPLKPTIVFDTYWRFAVERQNIFFRRMRNDPAPWTNDPVLREHKFTNAYRASDRVSQYLIRNVIGGGDQSSDEIFFRILVFKIFNRIETWELLENEVGQISFCDFKPHKYDKVLTRSIESGVPIYSGAYIMPSGGPGTGYSRKHRLHLHLIEQMMRDSLPNKLAEAGSMAKAFGLLKAYPTIGDFLAFQYITDVNYSSLTDFKETDFVVAGPGAKDGIKKCFSDFGGLTENEIIRFVTERQEECFAAVGVTFPSLWGRPLQLIDCQNLFCEVDKYSRVAHPEFSGVTGRLRIKQKLRPKATILEPWYPPKWQLNHLIRKGVCSDVSII